MNFSTFWNPSNGEDVRPLEALEEEDDDRADEEVMDRPFEENL